jgi:hypothetical protein
MNKYALHVYVIPEDDRDRQIADGFVLHHQVKDARILVVPPAGGWPEVIKTFRDDYVKFLRNYRLAHVVMLIDFDGHVDERRVQVEQQIPDDLKERVFVVGSKDEPETLKKALNISYEEIGKSLANDCAAGTVQHWGHEQLHHNEAVLQRMVQTVKPFLF